MVKNHQELANMFNEYFINVTTSASTDNNTNNPTATNNLHSVYRKTFPQMQLAPITTKEIKDIIKSLPWKNSCGYDEIPIRILKISMPLIASPLTYLCNKSMFKGSFPTRLKYSQIIPIHKKGNKSELSNYRPISLLTSFSKIFEKMIYIRLNNHIILNKILAKEQYGFRSNTMTEKAIYQLTNKILKAIDDKEWVGGLFCDLSKAFDYVNHDILLEKLNFYGISGTANELLKSYLSNRYQRVKIKNNYSVNYYSEWDNVKQGVPQGSVLGPLLFLLYINDLPDTINDISSPILFADDTNIICTHKNFNVFKDGIEIVFQKINKWIQANLLTLNFNKTNFIHFSTKPLETTQAHIKYEDKYIENVNNTKFLGLVVDNTLSWRPHVDKLSAKLNSATYIIRTLKPILTLKNLKMIYYSYVHSIMSYGLIFWGNSSHSNIIFKIQKRIIRIITHSHYRASCRDLFKSLNILPLQSQYILSLAMFVVGNFEEFTTNSDIHSLNTRQKSHLHLPSTRMTKCQKGVYYMGVKIYNKLPFKIRSLSSNKKQFHKTLKKFLLLGSFYTVEEFYNWSTINDLHAAYL